MIKEHKRTPITVIYGKDPSTMTELLLSAISLGSSIEQGSSIAIKPNLVVASPSDGGGTTTPDIIEGIIRHLQAYGHKDISVIESSWIGDSTKRAYKVCGYEHISRRTGVPMIDLKQDNTTQLEIEDRSYDVCRKALEADVLINVPVLKGHCQTRMTGALKNLKGCIPDSEKRRYHSLGLHQPIADINRLLKPDWIIMDAICGDLSFEEGGDPSTMHRMIAGFDPVLIDSYGCALMGLSPKKVPYIMKAAEYGVGRLFDNNPQDIMELNSSDSSYELPRLTRKVNELSNQQEACSACWGALVRALMDIDDELYERFLTLHEQRGTPLFAIGQGFSRSEAIDCLLGIGSCTSAAEDNVSGCPPTPDQIRKHLETLHSLPPG